MTLDATDGSKVIGYYTDKLAECGRCGGKTFPGHFCDE
jgi:hypothetical protein